MVKKANKLNHTHEKIFIPFIAIAIATLSSCNGEKEAIDETCNCRKDSLRK
jgi:hypothetical protein